MSIATKRLPHKLAAARTQRGAIIIIVLVVLVAMTLGALATYRATDLGSLLAGNVSFKRDAVNRANGALNSALTVMASSAWQATAVNQNYCQSACTNIYNYSPRLLETDSNGVPKVMLDTSTFDSHYTLSSTDSASGMKARFLIERMCYSFGEVSTFTCVTSGAVTTGGDQRRDRKTTSSTDPLYRVTVRVDGPRSTLAYAQAVVAVSSDVLASNNPATHNGL